MDDEDNVLFVRGAAKNENFTSADDVWDDTVLIKAYDKAINLAKNEVAKRIGTEMENTRKKNNSQNPKKSNHGKTCTKWTVGSPCRAIHSNDGEIYEAIIMEIYENTGTCLVEYIGYQNTEIVELSELCESGGLNSRMEQLKNCQEPEDDEEFLPNENSCLSGARANGSRPERMDYESELPGMPKNIFNPGASFNSSYGIMPPAPPLPPQLMSKLPDNDADALSSMLMSWYISGFHTGYYHGIKQARNLEKKRKK